MQPNSMIPNERILTRIRLMDRANRLLQQLLKAAHKAEYQEPAKLRRLTWKIIDVHTVGRDLLLKADEMDNDEIADEMRCIGTLLTDTSAQFYAVIYGTKRVPYVDL